MHLIVASAADASMAALAFADFPAMINSDMIWLNPFAATACRTIDPIPCIVFLEFPIPSLLEVLVEQFLHMLQRDMLGSATPGWHVCRIRNRHVEDTSQAVMTHAVCAGEFCGFGHRHIVRATSQTRYLFLRYCRVRRQET